MRLHEDILRYMSIAIEAAELMELYQWKNERDSLELSLHNEGFRAKLNDEIADVLIYCLSLANVANLDLMSAVEAKMDRNDQRFPASYRLI